jgi:Flp pilus assembly protein TadD
MGRYGLIARSDKAHTLLAQSNFDLAKKFLERALVLEPTNLEARELLGIAELEEGDAEKGRAVRVQSFGLSCHGSNRCMCSTASTAIVSTLYI